MASCGEDETGLGPEGMGIGLDYGQGYSRVVGLGAREVATEVRRLWRL